MFRLKKIAVAIIAMTSMAAYSAEPYDSSRSYNAGEQVIFNGKTYEAQWWAGPSDSPGSVTENSWDSPWIAVSGGGSEESEKPKPDPEPEPEPEPDTGEPPTTDTGDSVLFEPGKTQVQNGDMVSHGGQCFIAKNNPGVWETPSANSWFWDVVECSGGSTEEPETGKPDPDIEEPDPEVIPPTVVVPPAPDIEEPELEVPEDITPPTVRFVSPTSGSVFKKEDGVYISISASDTDDNLNTVVITANNQQICDFEAANSGQFNCSWYPSQAGSVILNATATDTKNLSANVSVNVTIEETAAPPPPPPVVTPPVTTPGDLCKDFNVYPEWTNGDHATGGDIMVYNNIAYSAIYWTQTVPGSDGSWALHVNCDGTEPGSAAHLSLRNPYDPISLELPFWPNTLVVASPSTNSPATLEIETIKSTDLKDANKLTSAFEAVIRAAENANSATVIFVGDVLDKAISNKDQFGSIGVKEALKNAATRTGSSLDHDSINALSDDLKGLTQAHNLIVTSLAPMSNHGWSIDIGDFAYQVHSGRQSVWDKASKQTAGLLDELELYKEGENTRSDFVAFNKSSKTDALTDDQWHNTLEYVKQVTDFVEAPAMLATVPTDQATTYFMGKTTAERQLRKAAYNNVFAILFDKDSADLSAKINQYQSAEVPLYSIKNASEEGALTTIPALNMDLANATNAMDNEAFLFETPESEWIPSTVYKWADFLEGLNAMHNTGVAGNKYWLIDKNADDETNIMYAKVAIAAFLAQSMQETIRYNACDENNWSETRFGAPTDYPMAASCGQLGQKYADYGFNPITGRDHIYSCPRNEKMEVSAITHAKWYGAPAPVFAVPDAVLAERGLLVNGSAGRWTNQGHCNDVPTKVDTSKQVWERNDCQIYEGQKAGKFIFDGSSQESVQGCGWWGRGVIQTTGRQNFGTLNHYLGRSHVDPSAIGKTIDGVKVEAPPANPLYPELDFCSDPGLICSSEENREIKWIAGLFYWVTSVQAYSNEGGPYSDWNYYNELKKYVADGLTGTKFIDDVSGIVNRGCPDVTCETGDVHNVEERRANFKLVLEKLGLTPR